MLLALLGALIFAASAHAEASLPVGTAEVPAGVETPAGGVGGEVGEGQGTTPSEGPEGGSVGGEAPGGEAPQDNPEPPPAEQLEPPPAEQVEPPPVETVPPPVESVIPTEQAPTVPVAPGVTGEKTEATTAPLAAAEETGKGTLLEASAQANDTHSASVAAATAEVPPSPPLAPSGVSEVSIHSAAEQAGSAAEIVSLGVAVRKTASQLSGQLSCELSALSGRSPGSCGAGLLGVQRLLLGSGTTLSGVSISLDPSATGVVPERGAHGSSSAVGGAPAGPAPGSSTGGSSGAAVGASGPAPSAFLSLACLLLLGAPRAMRRLRLSSRPLLTASFVLIPERPG